MELLCPGKGWLNSIERMSGVVYKKDLVLIAFLLDCSSPLYFFFFFWKLSSNGVMSPDLEVRKKKGLGDPWETWIEWRGLTGRVKNSLVQGQRTFEHKERHINLQRRKNGFGGYPLHSELNGLPSSSGPIRFFPFHDEKRGRRRLVGRLVVWWSPHSSFDASFHSLPTANTSLSVAGAWDGVYISGYGGVLKVKSRLPFNEPSRLRVQNKCREDDEVQPLLHFHLQNNSRPDTTIPDTPFQPTFSF